MKEIKISYLVHIVMFIISMWLARHEALAVAVIFSVYTFFMASYVGKRIEYEMEQVEVKDHTPEINELRKHISKLQSKVGIKEMIG